jgi:hypothetical protein
MFKSSFSPQDSTKSKKNKPLQNSSAGGFYKRRRGILEHIENDKIDLLENGIHDYLCLKANLVIGSKSSIPAGVCFTSAPAIHAHCRRVSERTIQRCLEHFEAIRWLKTFKTPGKRGNYPALLCRASVHDLSGKEYRVNAEATTDWRHPVYEPVGDLSGNCRRFVRKKAGNREVRGERENREKETNPLEAEGGGFEEFWKVYPRKENKRKSYQAWKKIKPFEIPAILSSVENWKQTDQWNREGGRYIPYPTTFLNDRRWEEPVACAAPQKSYSEEKRKFDDLPIY